MSLRRFILYFVALAACAVTAFPQWVPANSVGKPVVMELEELAPLPVVRLTHHGSKKATQQHMAVRPGHLVASN